MTSNQDKSVESINRLSRYEERTSLEDIPTNQYGRCNRKKILAELDIKGSKDHDDVKSIFKKIDENLGKSPVKKFTTTDSDEYVKELQNRINDLEKRVAAMSSELSVYKKHDGLIKHLVETGALVR